MKMFGDTHNASATDANPITPDNSAPDTSAPDTSAPDN